jgi:hypothetical protein
MTISGLMVVRNGFRLGYPFREAIRSALPICDEFIAGDGGSDDGTWEALQRLRECHPQLRLFRHEWPAGVDRRDVIAVETNRLKAHCRSRWCLNLQASEIVHERALPQLAREPVLHPEAEMFRLPFVTIMGTSFPWQVDHRRRLIANRPEIVSRGDGFDCGYDRRRLWQSPRKALSYVLHRRGERTVWLPAPVFRYRGLFPVNYLRKMRSRTAPSAAWRRELAHAERAWEACDPGDAPSFWRLMTPFFGEGLPDVAEAPAIVRPLFDRWEYSV